MSVENGQRAKPRVAVLYQNTEPPVIDGTRKPMKPGGYQDSGADIGYALSLSDEVEVITQSSDPVPEQHAGWCFPDTEEGILQAIERGATHLWANTILFASHPIQASTKVGKHQNYLRVVGQGPLLVEKYDNKDYVNGLLRRLGGFTMPRAWSLPSGPITLSDIDDCIYPLVVKPARGRGSYGVKICKDASELISHAESLRSEGLNLVMVEEYLAGEEATVTVMPPSLDRLGYLALPVVTRFNHQDGIAPYNGTVAVSTNSRAVVGSDDPAYEVISRECENVARALGVTGPIRIDVRRYGPSDPRFVIFDVNMKPNMTGPGRPGREDQACLSLLAAGGLGWDYQRLLKEILGTAVLLTKHRSLHPQ
ncbi:hypothetical protein D7B24_003236 [Verticillium nonalfalfae]|uniref:ATP-grasp domain-containing protein n=1 Tax=Verticillium nonalfalfae TaxID=1051616 RepID=A0A3M9YEZ0_9PEZI|nr:uncharacterized protein D7B24_003236 [Verticillium nonalfalfae]RNJ59143.1 hypothetical protein D7B24_003236 [Verticillium nonalfalfae]